jgi:hypothetical protein
VTVVTLVYTSVGGGVVDCVENVVEESYVGIGIGVGADVGAEDGVDDLDGACNMSVMIPEFAQLEPGPG